MNEKFNYPIAKILAEEITALYHGKAASGKAREAFISQFSKGELPGDISIKNLYPE